MRSPIPKPGTPVLSVDGERIIALFSDRMPFHEGDTVVWTGPLQPAVSFSEMTMTTPPTYSATRIFHRGPLDVWQMGQAVELKEWDRVFGDLFTFPNEHPNPVPEYKLADAVELLLASHIGGVIGPSERGYLTDWAKHTKIKHRTRERKEFA